LLALVTPLSTRLRVASWLRNRWPLVACSVALTLAWRLPGAAPPPRSLEGVAALLGAQVSGSVAPDEFVWERSRGAIVDPLLGRDVLFLARGGTSAHRDLYRARVRVTREGRPIALLWVRNLTQTPLADEGMLIARDHHAAFVTRAFDSVQAVTVLDLRGHRKLAGDGILMPRPWSWLWMQLDGWLEEGSLGGLGRSEMVFGRPPIGAKIELRDGSLIVALSGGPGEPAKAAALDIDSGRVNTGAQDDHRTLGWRAPWVEKPLTEVLRTLLGVSLGGGNMALASGEHAADPDPPARSHENSWPPAAIAPWRDWHTRPLPVANVPPPRWRGFDHPAAHRHRHAPTGATHGQRLSAPAAAHRSARFWPHPQ